MLFAILERNSTMRKKLTAALLMCLFVPLCMLAQTSNASLSGSVTDASGALVPSVTITATNNATGVENTALSNDAGVYSFPSLLPGQYRVSATQPGFQTETYTDVQLGNAAQVRLNFTLKVGQVQQAVEVSVADRKSVV